MIAALRAERVTGGAGRAPSSLPRLSRSPTGDRGPDGACACGGGCPRCTGASLMAKLAVSEPGDALEREADTVADAVIAGGRLAGDVGAPAVPGLQRCGSVPSESCPCHDAPPVVGEVLRSPGETLDAETRSLMESRFGRDFGDVRVHADELAAESARSVNALAYTVGRDIVFDAGQYAPGTSAGERLLAHELAHVAQQDSASHDGTVFRQRKPDPDAGTAPDAGQKEPDAGQAPTGAKKPADANVLDATAKAIIAKAQDTTKDAEVRAVEVVNAIIDAYYPGERAKVDAVVFDDAKAGTGLDTVEAMSADRDKAKSRGKISVGNYFLNGTTERHFARRVLQVGHELEHINQWRTGLAGGQNANEREFLAFYHEALDPEKPGTGRMQRATRVSLIDAALGHYYCLDAAKQKEHEAKKKELLDRRPDEVKASGSSQTSPPTTCKGR